MSGTNGFILEGRTAYPEAVRATRAFELELQDRLRAVVASRKKWGPFDHKRTVPNANSGAGGSSWVSLTLGGQVGKDRAWLEVGFWWNPPGAPQEPFLYACFYLKDQQNPVVLDYDRSVPGVRDFKWKGGTMLLLPMPEDMDPKPGLTVLLDVIVRAI